MMIWDGFWFQYLVHTMRNDKELTALEVKVYLVIITFVVTRENWALLQHDAYVKVAPATFMAT